MQTTDMISQDEVLTRASQLPAFPSVIGQILNTIDNPDTNLKVLIDLIAKDPVMTSQVISRANRIATFGLNTGNITKLSVATTLIGTVTIRHIALIGGFFQFSGAALGDHTAFAHHSIATGLCNEELGNHLNLGLSPEAMLIAGLLHDIGKLWLLRFRQGSYLRPNVDPRVPSTDFEMQRYGVDHAQIGYWLAEHWKLPAPLCRAIRHHHTPERHPDDPLIALTHVADVLSRALELAPDADNHVRHLSYHACGVLGMKWDDEVRKLFGRIDAKNCYLIQFFRTMR